MREFNDFEKAVITALVEARRSNDIKTLQAAHHIMDATSCYAIEWDTTENNEKVVFCCEDNDAPISVTMSGLDIIALLKYLEDNGYVLATRRTLADEQRLYNHIKIKYEYDRYWRIGEGIDYAIGGCKQILYTDAALLFERYANAIIYPTTELEQYVNRGFKTQDDVKFEAQQNDTKQSIRVARWGIFIAIILGLLGLLATYLSTKTPITLNQEQYNSIIENVRLNTIPETVDVKITNDTLDVNIKESIKLNTRSHITNMPKP